MSRSVLITGAGGFVGSHLCEGLVALGYAVTAFDRHFDRPTRERLKQAELIEAPLTRETLGALEGPFDMLIHGAAITTSSDTLGISELAHLRINLDLLVDALDFAVERGVRCFVFVSSSGVFLGTDAAEVRESTPALGTGAYALAKRAGELIVGGFARTGFSTLVVRLGPVYGPSEARRETRDVPSLVRRWLDAIEADQPILVDAPESRRDWTFAPDLPRAINALVKKGANGIVHLTSGAILSDLALAKTIAGLKPGIEVDTNTPCGAVRVPMVSERTELDDFTWTPLASGLAQILEIAA